MVAVIGLCIPPLSLLAILLAWMAWPNTSTGREGGHGMTVAALLLGCLVAIPMVLVLAFMSVGLMIPDSFAY